MTIASVVRGGTVALCASAPFFSIIFFVSVCCVFCVCVLFTKALRSPPLLFLILLLSLCESVSCSVYVYIRRFGDPGAGDSTAGAETPGTSGAGGLGAPAPRGSPREPLRHQRIPRQVSQ